MAGIEESCVRHAGDHVESKRKVHSIALKICFADDSTFF